VAVRGLYVHIGEPERRALATLAEQEWRRPSDQAGLLLAEALRRRGALVDDPTEPEQERAE
jgi:hypothetical protein